MLFGRKRINPTGDGSSHPLIITIDDETLEQVEQTKFLGVIVDSKLTWQYHIANISSKISKLLYVFTRVRYVLDKSSLLTLYYSLIYPHLTYCVIIWGAAAKTYLDSLILLQKRVIRIVSNSAYLSHSSRLFLSSRILKVYELYKYYVSLFVYKFLNNCLPSICANLLCVKEISTMPYSLRSPSCFEIPHFRTTVRERSIMISGPRIWNELPREICESASFAILKQKLISLYIKNY